ncbi:sigma-70 family RNA polymerase sigma factor [Daejeonella sp.]|uniref:RNA polymerase sigma factor n=1 Tax=Daejeonella sp. TaxID=2805397 RepID=UPI0030BAA582
MSERCCNLWKSFRTGDKLAFGQLMRENFRHLFNYGSKFSHDDELVKDVIQDLFLKLWEKRLNLSDDVNPKAYLTASLRRALHRKIQSQSKFSSYAELNELDCSFDLVLSVEQDLIDKESTLALASRIAANLSELPARQREVVYLKFFQDFSRDEISKTMQITPQTVSNLLQLALKKLRIELKSRLVVCLGIISPEQQN